MSYAPLPQDPNAFLKQLLWLRKQREAGALLDCVNCGADADEESVEIYGEATCLRCLGHDRE